MTAIEKLARAAIGVDDQRGDLLALENLSFQTAPVEAPAAPGKLDQYRLLVLPWAGALRYVGITLLFLLVYALVLRPVKKQAIAAFKQIPGHLAHARSPRGAAPVPVLATIELPQAQRRGQARGGVEKRTGRQDQGRTGRRQPAGADLDPGPTGRPRRPGVARSRTNSQERKTVKQERYS